MGKFCSRECKVAASKIGQTLRCVHCQQEFYIRPSFIDQKFCSRLCYEEHRKRTVSLVACQWCGKDFAPTDSHISRGFKYCSRLCSCKALALTRVKRSPVIKCAYCSNLSKRSVTYLYKQVVVQLPDGTLSWRRSKMITHKKMFCNRECYGGYMRLYPDEHPRIKALMYDPIERAINAVRLNIANSVPKVYKPEFLRMLLEWRETTCSYPGCNKVRSKHNKSQWKACWYHNQLISTSLKSLEKRRKKVLQQFGFEPI